MGRFELIERIGSGGMAEVFRAAVTGPEGFRRELVVKRVLPELTARPRFTQMFVNEAKISALLAHPNIVQIFEFGESDGAYFIAMESVRGLTLREVMTNLRQQETVMPVLAAAAIMREVLVALDYAHNLRDADGRRLEIVHRDVSPSNIILADTGGVKVLDFGIARAADLMADDEGKVVKGKIAYLAPEQVTFGDIDARVDVFASGCVLYELLTGRPMFRAHNNLQRKIELLAQPTPPPSALNSDVPPALDAIVALATVRDRNARYQSVGAMLSDIESYLEAFQSSSRAILRLMRLMSNDPRVDQSSDRNKAAVVQSAVPEPVSNTGATRPAKLLQSNTIHRSVSVTPRSSRGDEDHSSSGGHAQALITGPPPVVAAAQSLLKRFPASFSDRRVRIGGLIVLSIAVLWGVIAGTQLLLGPVPKVSIAAAATTPATVEAFVMVRIQSTPAGAKIIDGAGHAIGTTPVTLPMPLSHTEVSLRVEKDGYRVATASLIPDRDQTMTVELRQSRRTNKAARKPAKPKHDARTR